MNRIVIAMLPLLSLTPATAQPAGAGGAQTKVQAEARAEMLFGRLDADHDGFITQNEVDNFAKAMTTQMGGDTRMGERTKRMFAGSDADHDGKISLMEAKSNADRRFDAVDTNHDGTILPDERQAARTAAGEAAPQ